MPDLAKNEQVIAEFETRYACRLPEDYRKFLLTYDGTPTNRNNCPLDGNRYTHEDWAMFDGKFLGIDTGPGHSFVKENDEWRASFVEDSWCPEGRDYVVICGEEGCYSAVFLLGIRGSVYGKVFFWTLWDSIYEWEGIESFTKFLSLLRTEEETRRAEPPE